MPTSKGFQTNPLPEEAGPRGDSYLLAVAIDAYAQCPPLSNCVRDAKALIAVLQERYGFEETHTHTLFNEEATLGNIYDRLDDLAHTITSDDNLLIYFSGHGFYHERSRSGHLIPVDARPNRRNQYLSNANLLNEIRAVNSFHTFLIVDSCFSGSLFARKNISGQAFAERANRYRSRWALAAGLIEEVDDGFHQDNSPFAKALLSFLRENTEPTVPASQLIQHVKRVTPHNARQTPVGGPLFKVDDVGGEFVFHLREGIDADEAAWQKAKDRDTILAYDDYLETYPDGKHAAEAQQRMEELEDQAAWEAAQRRDTIPAYRRYLQLYKKGAFRKEAAEAIAAKKKAARESKKEQPEPKAKEVPVKEPPPSRRESLYETVPVEGGNFKMGSEDGRDNEKPVHEVHLESFHIGKYPVTFDLYDRFCESTGQDKPKDKGWGRGRRPVIYVNWYDAVEFANWLSEQEGLEKVYRVVSSKDGKSISANWERNGYRLPTEAEWEYAARGGGQVRMDAARGGNQSKRFTYAGSNELDEVGWYEKNAAGKTHPVGEKKANELGIYDMSGNVWEWCWDWYDSNYYKKSAKENPQGPDSGSYRVRRGGAWLLTPRHCRVAYRPTWYPTIRSNYVGFRLVRS